MTQEVEAIGAFKRNGKGNGHAPVNLGALRQQLEKAKDPKVLHCIEGELDAFERHLKASGILDEIQPVRELRMRARWMLGQALAKVERAKPRPGRTTSTGLTWLLDSLNLNKQTALTAQRLGKLPRASLEQAFIHARKQDTLITLEELIRVARPYWYQANRKDKHRAIFDKAQSRGISGPYPLIYADPPWTFHAYNENGSDRTPSQHYPTLSDQQIYDLHIDGVPMCDVAGKDAALFLWCTSSNVHRALWIMEGWGFEFKSSATWVKTKANGKLWTGLGLVFRNAHELLLYGTKGNMPGPQWQPPSVVMCQRGKHSAKPPEVRKLIERMYPDFDASARLEAFSRDDVKGWTHWGLEA